MEIHSVVFANFFKKKKKMTLGQNINNLAEIMICCGLNKLKYWIDQCCEKQCPLSLFMCFIHTVLHTSVKNIPCFQVAVETHPCRKPFVPDRSFCSASLCALFKNDNLCLRCTAFYSLSHFAPCLRGTCS